jgi:hypothetical protein
MEDEAKTSEPVENGKKKSKTLSERTGFKPTTKAQTAAASLVLIVLLTIILGEAFSPVLGFDVKLPLSAYPLLAAVLIFWFNIKISDIYGGRKG